LASANTLNLAPYLGELLGDVSTCTSTCNQRGRLTGIASAHPVVTNKRAQRQMSASGVCTSHLQPSRVPTAPHTTPTGVVDDSCGRAPAHHEHPAEFCAAAATLAEHILGGWRHQGLARAFCTCAQPASESDPGLCSVLRALEPLVAATRGPSPLALRIDGAVTRRGMK
jgi:hypothetical protein